MATKPVTVERVETAVAKLAAFDPEMLERRQFLENSLSQKRPFFDAAVYLAKRLTGSGPLFVVWCAISATPIEAMEGVVALFERVQTLELDPTGPTETVARLIPSAQTFAERREHLLRSIEHQVGVFVRECEPIAAAVLTQKLNPYSIEQQTKDAILSATEDVAAQTRAATQGAIAIQSLLRQSETAAGKLGKLAEAKHFEDVANGHRDGAFYALLTSTALTVDRASCARHEVETAFRPRQRARTHSSREASADRARHPRRAMRHAETLSARRS